MNTKQTKEGWWIIEQDTHVGRWIEESGELSHDRFLIPVACSNLKPGGVVMDCGALYGDHTIAYARVTGSEGAVIAIEPNPMAFECLTKNAEKFESTIVLLNVCLGEEHGAEAIHIMSDNVGASRMTEKDCTPEELPDSRIENKIKTASIDGICRDAALEKLDFIKLDIEGWEYKALRGARDTLKNFRPLLLIEMNSWALSQQGSCYKDIYDLLLKENYSWRIVQPDCKGGDAMYDILAWPNLIEKIDPIVRP